MGFAGWELWQLWHSHTLPHAGKLRQGRGGNVPMSFGAVGTPDPPNGAGGRQQPEERVNNRESKVLPPQHQTAARGGRGGFTSASNPPRVTHVTSVPGLSTATPTALGGCRLGMGDWAVQQGVIPIPSRSSPPRTDGNVPGRWKVSWASKWGQGGFVGAAAPWGGHSGRGSFSLAGLWAGGWQQGPHCREWWGSPAPLSGAPRGSGNMGSIPQYLWAP